MPQAVRQAIGCVAQKSGVDSTRLAGRTSRCRDTCTGYAARCCAIASRRCWRASDSRTRLGAIARTYSGGMQRKLDIAMGLIHTPRVLFLDEPTTGLDPEARTDLWEEIARLSRQDAITVLLTTHYLEEADRLADRLAIVDRGRIVAEGEPETLKGELFGDAVQVEFDGTAPERPRREPPLRACRAARGPRRSPPCAGARRSRRHGSASMLAALEAGGVKVASVRVARPSLDDVYLRYAGPLLQRGRSGRQRDENAVGLARHHGPAAEKPGRQPWWIAISLAQPIVYLLLYAQLFKRVVELPGFNASSYLTFVTPGIVVMTALFGGGWNGMGIIQDLDRGIMDRFLVSPISRVALIAGRLLALARDDLIQSAILLTLAALSARGSTAGVSGLIVLVVERHSAGGPDRRLCRMRWRSCSGVRSP